MGLRQRKHMVPPDVARLDFRAADRARLPRFPPVATW